MVGLFLTLLGICLPTLPCTVAVVSGKATPDGRALLWKNRDTSAAANKVVFVKGERFDFIALINADDKSVEHAWAGINTQGFAIMNSASRDLAESPEKMSDNGRFMRAALGKCADVSDFEKFLFQTKGERRVGANFGVMDAKGNASIFETRSSSYVKFDSADPRVAPQGYILRTNYAYTSPIKNGARRYIRYERARRLFRTAYAEGRLDHKFILQEAARDLVNEKTHSYPLSNSRVLDPTSPLYINTNDTINRNSTVSVALFHGAPHPEKAHLATMWVLLGQPVSTVAVPLWAHAGEVPLVCNGPGTSILNDFSRALTSFLYPDQRGHMYQYLSLSRLLHYKGEGVLKKLFEIENQLFSETADKLTDWGKQRPSPQEMKTFQEKLAIWAYESLRKAFPDIETSD
jgi:hypothetical protein